MAIFGVITDKDNPEYTINDFCFWMPQFKNYMDTEEGQTAFDNLYPIANSKIYESIFGTDWKLAMSYCIAHYLTLIAQQLQAPAGDTLAGIAGGGVTRGVLSSAHIGGFDKTYDLSKTMLDSQEALFWNQTSYGASLMALLKTKPIPSIMVVVNDPMMPYVPAPTNPANPIVPFNVRGE